MHLLWSWILLDILWTAFVNSQELVSYQNQTVAITEGEPVSLYCEYKVSNFNGLRWYRQKPGERPDHLIYVISDGKSSEGKFTADLRRMNSECSLHISNPSHCSMEKDAAVSRAYVEEEPLGPGAWRMLATSTLHREAMMERLLMYYPCRNRCLEQDLHHSHPHYTPASQPWFPASHLLYTLRVEHSSYSLVVHLRLSADMTMMHHLWSGILLNILWTAFVNSQQLVSYQNETVTVIEGESVSLYCEYKVTAFNGLRWYRQKPGERPDHLINVVSDGRRSEGKFAADLQRQTSQCSLHISNPSVGDSAVYLCAVQAQCVESC